MRPSLLKWLLWVLTGPALFAQIFIVEPPHHHPPDPRPLPSPELFPLALSANHIEVHIEEQLATIEMDQVFRNATRQRFQGYYLFPLPADGAISGFSLFIDGREMAPELLDAGKARRVYEDIVRRMADPALLEYSGQSLLRLKIFPVNPGEERRIKLRYQQVLEKENSTTALHLPLKTAPYSTTPLRSLRISIDVHSAAGIHNIFCPTHELDIRRKGANRARIGLEAENIASDRDLRLFFDTNDRDLGLALLSYRDGQEDGFFFMSLSSGELARSGPVVEKDVTFVLDVSGSMAGEKLRQAKKALLFCIENLHAKDRFEMVRFSTTAEALFGSLRPATPAARQKARDFVENLHPIGGTNIGEALELALSNPGSTGRPHYVVFITDGKPTVGETAPENLLSKVQQLNRRGQRIFTFGIGEEVNTHLLDKIAGMTHGYRTYIAPDEDIELRISGFYEKIASPVLSNITLQVESPVQVYDLYPRTIPDVFKGSSVNLLGRYRGNGRTRILLEGFINGEIRRYEYHATFAKSNIRREFIPPLWAARAVGYLLDQIRLHGESEELKAEIISLAKAFGIVTPYTSYLIVEDETAAVARRELPLLHQLLREKMAPEDAFAQAMGRAKRGFRAESGALSIRSSEEIQSLSGALRPPEGAPARGQGEHRPGPGMQIRRVNGRAFYRSGGCWVDPAVQHHPDAPVVRIPFAGDTYFELLRNNPQLSKLLSLGKNLRFWLDGKIYEIYE